MVTRFARALATTAALLPTLAAQAQTVPLSREEAVASALLQGTRLGLARADTAVAFAQIVAAREWPNPTASAAYSKDVPHYHYALEIPVDVLQRGPRVGAARAGRAAAQFRFAFERAAAALDADTAYTRAVAAREKARLSRRNQQDADSLRRIAMARRDAGDASDLDVELATVSAGQAANIAAADSLTYISAVLDLQAVMGLRVDSIVITPTDSLGAPLARFVVADTVQSAPSAPLQVAAARASVESARLGVRVQRRGLFGAPSVIAGFDTGDPDIAGLLPTVGLALPIPLFNRNRGAVRLAEAELARAGAELTLAEVQSRTEVTRARRELAIAAAKVERDRVLVASAQRVVTMSLTAYREGASSLPNVLEAQRSARDVLAQYVDDLAAVWIGAAKLRVLTLTGSPTP
jgi:cobalt-zinc-cadmium efflux system outer membrane protein